MPYDQSWMGFGVIGGLEAGGIALVVGALALWVFHAIGKGQGWPAGLQLTWAWLASVVLAGGGDLWNLFYFNFGRLQSLELLRARLATVHDPDSIGLRVVFELVGAGIGVGVAWWWLVTRRRQAS